MNQEALTKTMLEAETWAVVGVSANPEKYGYPHLSGASAPWISGLCCESGTFGN